MEIKLEYFVPAIQIAGQVRIRCKDIYVNLFDLPFSNGFDRYGCFQKSKQKFFRYIYIYIGSDKCKYEKVIYAYKSKKKDAAIVIITPR